ncbi:c-type cytochrome [Plasticicumulans acidivorans]|uniref:Cbb3-type cytochrome c oxidase subunit III n=1 Tax=Plasticicumulans acidivorans TaxID=886464 RepID=A0A317MYU6_9GAMM|nr:c-type cytochrome [Plasticicumulans acidivorans]PWV64805.1 cbb3-type cytochrome c oxidase subunit III [Plasticicumulans acidivorans]
MNKLFLIAATSALIGSASLAWAAGDAAAGQAKSAMCAACHSADGNSVSPDFPKLAGQNAGYLYKQLTDFKSGARVNATMSGMVAPLSDQDMQDLAAYFSSQQMSKGETDPALANAGQAVFRGGNLETGVAACMACHGVTGKGNEGAKFPALAGQHAKYVELQLMTFRSVSRTNDPGMMMRNVAAKMSDAEIKAVASYVQGLQ